METINSVIHFFIPNIPANDLEFRKSINLIWALVVLYFFTLNYAIISFFVDFNKGVLTEILSSFVYLILLFYFRWKGKGLLVSNLAVFTATGSITICCWYSGGYHSAVLPWLGFPAILVMLISDKKSGISWVIINTLIISLICTLYAKGFVFPNEYDPSMKLFESVCYIGLVVILFLIAMVFENGKNKAINDLGKQIKTSENLLLNILPCSIADRLKKGEMPLADYFEEASVVFIDLVNYTEMGKMHKPDILVTMLNEIFSIIDELCIYHKMEKIKTIGDCYMAVSGVPKPEVYNTVHATNFALSVVQKLSTYKSQLGQNIGFRIGIDCGPVVAGVIGNSKFIYDLWGDAVNTASRMESSGVINKIHCTDNFKKRLETFSASYQYTAREKLNIKGKGIMQTWLIHV